MVIRDVTDVDIAYLADHMKYQDVLEVNAVAGVDPKSGIEISLDNSYYSKVLEVDGEPVAVGGVLTSGMVWILTVDNVQSFARELTVAAKEYIDLALCNHDLIFNYVAQENETTLRWLKRLGFKQGEPKDFSGVPFTLMYKEA